MVRLWWNRFGPLFAGDIRRQGTVKPNAPAGNRVMVG
jgi:hypothetical protein